MPRKYRKNSFKSPLTHTDPETLPPGAVLVVGSAQSGCQIAEELNEAGGKCSYRPARPGAFLAATAAKTDMTGYTALDFSTARWPH